MSKQYMTIQFGDRTATVRTNSEKAIKNALGKLRIHSNGTVVSFIIKGDIIEFEGTSRKASWGYWEPTTTYRARIIENTFVTEETAEVVEAPAAEVVEAPATEVVEAPATEVVEAPATEVVEAPATEEHTITMTLEEKRAAWDIFVKEWAKSRADEIKAIRAAEARIVEDVAASYDDDAIDEALDAIRDAVIAGRPYAHLIEEAQDLGATRHAISDVIRDAKDAA